MKMKPSEAFTIFALAFSLFSLWYSFAHAQDVIASFDVNGTMTADWPRVERCAAEPYAAEPNSRVRRATEDQFQRVLFCRNILAARHAGWIAAGGDPAADPIQPAPMNRDDDFKRPLVCSDDQKDGAALLYCKLAD